MKKLLTMACALALTLCALTGCQRTQQPPETPTPSPVVSTPAPTPEGDGACVYTDEELCRLALRDYEGRTGLDGSGLTVEAESGEDGMVTIQIYEDLSDHNATAAWYRVDRRTAAGTDLISGEAVELATGPVELRVEFASQELPAQPGAYDEYIAQKSEYLSKVALTAQIDLGEFRVVALEPVEDGEQGFKFRIAEELYSPGTLTAGRPLVIGLELPETVPNLGVCYRDGTGAEKLYAIGDSGMDGAPLLIAVTAAE